MPRKKNTAVPPDEAKLPIEESMDTEETSNEATATNVSDNNAMIRQIFDQNFMEYASYVIKERAIPDVDDGMKPVQRRILWSMFRMDDGRLHKVANIIGHTMQFHPHGDASIGDALVVLANKELFVDHQGNFGNIFTGDSAAAPRYIESRLSPLGREVLFNNELTPFIDSYDGRNKEPVRLPVKIPALLIAGSEGIAVGMSTSIPPHNFCETIEAQIAILKNEPYTLYPDFRQGGLMDVSEYNKGVGKIEIRALIEKNGRNLRIVEIPYGTNTEKIIESIEKAAEKGKIKIQEIRDHTTKDVCIEITLSRGYDPDKAINALYAYTLCQVNFNANIIVIKDGFPATMTVDQILLRNTERLLTYLKAELEIKLADFIDRLHARTLERIFIEERIYKKIEECDSKESVYQAVYKGLAVFKKELIREPDDSDIERLLAIPIRRISLFDIQKNLDEIQGIQNEVEEVLEHLKKLNAYAINYLKEILKKYGKNYPRHTQITTFEKINLKAAALSNIKVGWDRKGGYVGSNVKSDESLNCTEYDRLLCIERNGEFQVIRIPDKKFINKLYDFRKYEPQTGFCMVYSDKKSGKAFWKRFQILRAVTDKDYMLCPKGCKIELLTTRLNATFEVTFEGRGETTLELNLWEAPERSARSRGLLIENRKFSDIKFKTLVDGVDVFFGDPTEEEEEDNEEYTAEENAPTTEGWTYSRKELEPLRAIIHAATEQVDFYKTHGKIVRPDFNPVVENGPTLGEKTKAELESEDASEAEALPVKTPPAPAPEKTGKPGKRQIKTAPQKEVEMTAISEDIANEEEADSVNTIPEEPPEEPQTKRVPLPQKSNLKDVEKKDKGSDNNDWGMVQMDLEF